MKELNESVQKSNPVNVKAMKMVDAVTLTAMFLFLIVPWFLAGLNIWGWLFVCGALVVLGFEIYSTIKNNKTISRIFWEFKSKHPYAAWIIFGAASIGWALLGFHLLA